MKKWVIAFFVLGAYGILLFAPPTLLAQSDPTEHVCTKDQADGKVYLEEKWDQDLKCMMGRFYRYRRYEAENDKYFCTLSELLPVNCDNAPSASTTTPSPSPSSTSSGTPSASLQGQYGLGGVNEQTLCLATDRLGGTKGSCDAFKSAAFLGTSIAGTQVSTQGLGGITEALGQFTKAQVPTQFLPSSLSVAQQEKNIVQKAVDAVKGFFFDFLLGRVFQTRK